VYIVETMHLERERNVKKGKNDAVESCWCGIYEGVKANCGVSQNGPHTTSIVKQVQHTSFSKFDIHLLHHYNNIILTNNIHNIRLFNIVLKSFGNYYISDVVIYFY